MEYIISRKWKALWRWPKKVSLQNFAGRKKVVAKLVENIGEQMVVLQLRGGSWWQKTGRDLMLIQKWRNRPKMDMTPAT